MSVDIITNEGVRALNHTITSTVKLYIEDAMLSMYNGELTESQAADLTLDPDSENPQFPASNYLMVSTCCLPTLVSTPSDSDPNTTENVSALDLEFSYLPQASVSYNIIGVRARYYYEISQYDIIHYDVGMVVSSNGGYYQCIEAYTPTAESKPPISDPVHWASVSVDETSKFPGGNGQWKALSNSYILLYVSKLDNPVALSAALEVSYKLRLFLTNVSTAAELQERVFFDTLGPEFSASAQLVTLKTIAEAFQQMRIAVSTVMASGSAFPSYSDLPTSQNNNIEQETEMNFAYVKTGVITSYEFSGEAGSATKAITGSAVSVDLYRMDDSVGGKCYLSGCGPTKVAKARVSIGGTGTLESRDIQAAIILVEAYIPSGASATGNDEPLGTFNIAMSRWNEWESKGFQIELRDDVFKWAEDFRTTKPYALNIKPGTTFYIQDFNIQDDFKEQTLPIYLELGVDTDFIAGDII